MSGESRAEVARRLDIDEQAVHYIRRKHKLPALFKGGGTKRQAKCRYGHWLTKGNYYEIKHHGYIERRCKECRRIQNLGRKRNGQPTKGELLSTLRRGDRNDRASRLPVNPKSASDAPADIAPLPAPFRSSSTTSARRAQEEA
jgi:hypothetical protein